jgi:primary-amine oxidase
MVDVLPEELDKEKNPYENAFYAEATTLTSEKKARTNMALEKMRTWKVINSTSKNAMGQYVGYKLMPGDNSVPLASPNSWSVALHPKPDTAQPENYTPNLTQLYSKLLL